MLGEMSFGELIEKIVDENEPLPRGDLSLLSGMLSDEERAFRARWPSATTARRRELLHVLVELAADNFEMDFGLVFRYSLNDDDAEVRRAAIEGLWEDESPALVSSLTKMLLEDVSAAVREEAAMSLGRFAHLAEMGDIDARRRDIIRDSLWSVIHDPEEDIGVRRRAVESIAHLSIDDLREIIDRAYEDENRLMRISALFAMGRSADPFWRGTVISELSNDDPEFRFEAARACGELGARQAVPVLSRLIKDRDAEVQEAAIWALGQIGGEQARRVLQACCESENELIQESAGEALAELELGTTSLDLLAFDLDEDDLPDFEDLSADWIEVE